MRRLRLAAEVAPKSTAVTKKTLTRMVWPIRVPRLLIRKDGVKTPYRQKGLHPTTLTREIWAEAGRAVHSSKMGLGPSWGATGVAPLSFGFAKRADCRFQIAGGEWSPWSFVRLLHSQAIRRWSAPLVGCRVGRFGWRAPGGMLVRRGWSCLS